MRSTLGIAVGLAFLLLSDPTVAEEKTAPTVRLQLVGANPYARPLPLTRLRVPSHYLVAREQIGDAGAISKIARSWFDDVYPGIDLITYGDDYRLEYVFVVAPGADPGLIRFSYGGMRDITGVHGGNLRVRLANGEIIQTRPVLLRVQGEAREVMSGRYTVGHRGVVSLDMAGALNEQLKLLNGKRLNVVPGGGQPGGPDYDFFMSKFEITNDQFLNFLNDIEANQSNPRGANTHVDAEGNLWMSPAMKQNRDELFSIIMSRLRYDPQKPVGSRYDHLRSADGQAPYAELPLGGASWYGALKYCNWLTLHAQRGTAQLCYTEGTNLLDWTPVTSTNWAGGVFGDAERRSWLTLRGFRLPMVNSECDGLVTNAFNEFLKAAAWQVNTNRLYAFGRDTFQPLDANFLLEGKTPSDLIPVGHFDGERLVGNRRTGGNDNFYGIFDLSGNAAEWMTDHGRPYAPMVRVVCGGSCRDAPCPVHIGSSVPPYATDGYRGFRVVTTYLPMDVLLVHVLFTFYLEPGVVAAGPPPDIIAGIIIPTAEEPPVPLTPEEAAKRKSMVVDVDSPPGTIDYVDPVGVVYTETPPEAVVPEVLPPGTGPSGEVLPGGVVTGAPPVALTTNRLTVIVTGLVVGDQAFVNLQFADVNGNEDQNAPPTFIRDYLSTATVGMNVPVSVGAASFQRWLLDGVPYGGGNNTVFVPMSSDVTMTAVYATAPLTVSLAFVPNLVLYSNAAVLVSSPAGGTGNYVDFRYRYDNHPIWNPGWTNSVFTSWEVTNVWDHYIKYQVQVQDSSGAWSPWSNEAWLDVSNVPAIIPPPGPKSIVGPL